MYYSDAEDDTPEVGGVEGVAEEGLGQQSDEEELPPSKKIKTDSNGGLSNKLYVFISALYFYV